MTAPIVVGVLGGRWRAGVTATGDVVPADRSPALRWSVVAGDRRYDPAESPGALRQRRLLGAPVVETAMRVSGGDVVTRTYAVADHGGLTVVELENRSRAPVAVVLSRNDLLTGRAASGEAVVGADLPPGSTVVPVAHGASARVALAHDGRVGGPLPRTLPDAEQVARGWRAQVDRSPRLVLPDPALAERVVSARAALLLAGDDAATDPDDVAALLAAGARARLVPPGHGADAGAGGDAGEVEALVDAVVVRAERVARAHRRARHVPWDVDAALAAAVDVLGLAGDARAAADAAAVRRRLGVAGPVPPADVLDDLDDPRALAAVAAGLARGRDGVVEVGAGMPAPWFGQGVEAYGVPLGPGTASVAWRWHGARPALLWEAHGVVRLSTPRLDPGWQASDGVGEALLAVPPDVTPDGSPAA